jgi:uncharacterized protein (TIGR02145 family)
MSVRCVKDSEAYPIADFSANPTTLVVGQSVQFTDLSTNNPISWNWSFGDGYASTLQNPSHTYSTAGNYTVTLQVTNQYGSGTETKTNFITVTENEEIGTFTDTRDNTTYSWVKIGTQIWMAENLKYNSTGSFCYGNNSSNEDIYGRLYSWTLAKSSCPTGWHLPSDNEWKELEMFLGMSQSQADIDGSYRGTDEGGKLKAVDNLWSGSNVGATNSSRFTALPGGCGWEYGDFVNIGTNAWLWTSDQENSSNGWCRSLSTNNSQIGRGGTVKGLGMSVRCVKD